MAVLGLSPSIISSTCGGAKLSKSVHSFHVFPSTRKPLHRHDHHHYQRNISTPGSCKATSASSSSSSSSITEFNLYDLLSIDNSSDQSQIKSAYRALQKRCHPDIAGPAGHDMAIILNEAYSVLSDPNSRCAYDKEQAKISEFHGYNGKPLYSMWFGSESEQRAVFVDEVKCIGCLKCALFASKTFAVESVYGRARVVAQWADPEDKILDAIQTCPVDCISIVERSDLAALEFLMSKQPRGNVRMTSGNTGGARVSNIFVDIDKFQRKFQEMKEKTSKKDSKEPDLQREVRVSAMQGIRAMANWLYWRSPTTATQTTESSQLSLIPTTRKPTKQQQPNTRRLQEAAARRRAGETTTPAHQKALKHEYWTPALIIPPPPSKSLNMKASSSTPHCSELKQSKDEETGAVQVVDEKEESHIGTIIPVAISVASAVMTGYRSGDQMGGGIREHIGGDLALGIVNSFWMQILLAAITWYLCGAAVLGLVKLLGSMNGFGR